jgi:glycosyltransferase involved in cell wall biosynthesis
MSQAKRRLLLDLTPLGTPGGARGIGRYTRELARGLAELPPSELEGIELLGLTSLGWTGAHTVTTDIAGFLEQRGTALLESRHYYSWAYRQRIAMWRAAKRLRVDAIHLCDPHATPRLLGLAGTKRIVTCHDIVPTRFPKHYFGWRDGGAAVGRYIEAERYRSADLVIAVSDATKNDICQLCSVPEARVVRVYNGVDVERWSTKPTLATAPTLQNHGLGGRAFALYVGGSDWRKNIEGMLAAVTRVRQAGLDLQLAWAGHLDAAHRARMQGKAAEAGIADAVHFLGHVPDDELAILYRAAVAHLFVSRLEGFGLTVVEAMASGCPVITTQAGSLAEVAGDAALTVDPEDPPAIAAALERLMQEPELRAHLVELGKTRAPRFSRRAQALATAKVYRQFLATE